MKKITLSLIAIVAVVGGVVAMSAFEAHVINVTAHIENALRVPTKEIKFGTVFPQEKLKETVNIYLSESFLGADRVDDVEYKIVQKPKFKGFLKTDILFAFDTTGSMGGAIADAKAKSVEIMNVLKAFNPDAAFGVVHFEDYNFSPYGGSPKPDSPYTLDLPITTDTGAVATSINALTLGYGGDGPQSYTRVMYESYSDSAIAWRTGAQRIVIILGDNVSHDNNLNSDPFFGVAPWGDAVPWETGYPNSYGDPGRDGKHDTADDLDFQTTLKGMKDNNVMLFYLSYGAYTANWDWWCGKTGGKAVSAAGSANIVEAIKDLFEYNFLCPHISKTKNVGDKTLTTDLPPYDTDVTVPHAPDAVALGKLTKAGTDIEDIWDIGLIVPCFKGMCAQDYNPDVYGPPLDPKYEGQDFGCDLWIEVTGISDKPVCGNKILEPGEECETATDCATGYACEACKCVAFPG